ncbi:hypothetical protein [Actinoplanes sp. M2I2]|uniref:hypothetical protein n=1 Tax=Actinoplanes sp. M2I2 TaxID=1734444 RepID=UPI0020227CCD|nr:hypothetical protein [Actinoplanes sp. M2I2]
MDIQGAAAHPATPEPGHGDVRGGGDLLLGLLTGSALAPFVQALATKAGEDVYAKIRALLGRRRAAAPPPEPQAPVVLADSGVRVVLRVPATLAGGTVAGLPAVRVPLDAGDQWVLVEYVPDSDAWITRVISGPPQEAIEVGGGGTPAS